MTCANLLYLQIREPKSRINEPISCAGRYVISQGFVRVLVSPICLVCVKSLGEKKLWLANLQFGVNQHVKNNIFDAPKEELRFCV